MASVPKRALLCLAAFAALVVAAPAQGATQDVLYVGNNWDGTADVINVQNFTRIKRLNIIPDKNQRLAEIMGDPVRQGFFLGIRQLVGEGHDQFVDDMFSSKDGREIYVSRPSFADVIAINVETGRIRWRTKVDGQRADHMAISPDGKRVLVSASTERNVNVIDTASGQIVNRFESGDQPHENNYSADGTKIFHASIGTVYTPTDQPALDATKGDRYFQVVDARNYRILKRIEMGPKMAEAGYPGFSSAVRPMALAPDEKKVYMQLSFFHGFVEFDLERDKVLRVKNLPDYTNGMPREEYLLDSAHHGLSMNPEGTKLCAAGTMSDYAAIVERQSFRHTIASRGTKPYWSTNSGDGKLCFVSYSGDDAVGVISYETEREVARFKVGDHPQRMRMGVAPGAVTCLGSRSRARRNRLAGVTIGRRRRALEKSIRVTDSAQARALHALVREEQPRPRDRGVHPPPEGGPCPLHRPGTRHQGRVGGTQGLTAAPGIPKPPPPGAWPLPRRPAQPPGDRDSAREDRLRGGRLTGSPQEDPHAARLPAPRGRPPLRVAPLLAAVALPSK